MSWIDGVGHRLRELFRPAAVDRELDEELRDHLEREAVRQARDAGDPDEARRRAALRAGRSELARDNVADGRTGRVLADAVRDLQYAVRSIRRSRGFAAAVILSLGLGVGGTTAIFTIVQAVLLRPLPYPRSEELHEALIWWGDFSATLSVADYDALQESAHGTAAVGGFYDTNGGFSASGPEGPEVLHGLVVTPELPGVLEVSPMAGPGLSSRERACQVLIGEDLWQRRYGARATAIGEALTLDAEPCTIVGVMPRGFHVPGVRDDEVWASMPFDPPTRRGGFFLQTIVRVPRRLDREAAAARLTALVTPILRDRYGITNAWQYRLQPEREALVGDVRETLLMLLAGVSLVLLVAIANVANLLLARGTVRMRELAVRASLGARRGRLARQLLTESALIGLLGGALGLGIAVAALGLARGAASAIIPRMEEVRLDAGVVAFALSAGLIAGLAAGVLPVLRLPWARLGRWLHEGGRSTSETARAGHLRRALVVAEIALTLMVLTASTLLVKSLLRAEHEDPGFRAAGVLKFQLTLPDDPYKDKDRFVGFLANATARLRALPGVQDAAASAALPPDLLTFSNNYTVEGQAPDSAGKSDVADWNLVTPEYFRTLGIARLAGRQFDGRDVSGAPDVAVVNEAFVRRHFPGGGALGRRLKPGDWDPSSPWTTIVGIVRDVPYGSGGIWNGVQPMVYVPYSQNSWYRSPYFVLRTSADPATLAATARRAIRELDPSLPLRDVSTMEEEVRQSMAVPRLRGTLFAALGLFALALSVTGIYGVMAYHVSRGRRETAIRRALGARSGQVVGATLRAGLQVVAAGVAIGLVAALAAARTLSSMLYRVEPRDPGVLTAAATLVVVAAVAACLVPAVAAARIDPAMLLREE